MASLIKVGQCFRVQFIAADGSRRSIGLGQMDKYSALTYRKHIKNLNSAKRLGSELKEPTADWLETLPDEMHARLVKVDLVDPRAKANPEAFLLGPFLDRYIARQAPSVKPNTLRNLEACRTRLVRFFGPDRPLKSITADDADGWLIDMRTRGRRVSRRKDAEPATEQGFAPGTIGRTVKRAKQFFRSAVRAKILTENPFQDLKAPGQANPDRQFIVTRDMAEKVLDACPDAEWRLIFALSRYGGLRCPSEHLALKWENINWDKNRMKVESPKTEHHDGKGSRVMPIFPELRPFLDEAFALALERAGGGIVQGPVIARYRGANSNLRTQLTRIIDRAGLKPWPRLFHNLRATRQTELVAARWPLHVVCEWLGNTELIAAKHYLKVTDADFEAAAAGGAVQKTVQTGAEKPASDFGQTVTSSPDLAENAGNWRDSPDMSGIADVEGYPQGDSNPCLSLERAMS
jgi:integrase